jgi:hypothetical protein
MRTNRRALALAIDTVLCAGRGALRGHALRCAATALIAAGVADATAATFVVDTAGDPGPAGTTSLREAVFQANGSADNVVQFDPALNGSTITLQNGEVAVTQPMSITGPGADKLTISGNDASRIFYVHGSSATPVTIDGLSLTAGYSSVNGGGAVYAHNAALTLRHAVVSNSKSLSRGGSLYCKDGQCSLSDVTISGNHAPAGAGVFFAAPQYVSHFEFDISDSRVVGNIASGKGGGIYSQFGAGTVTRTKVVGNSSGSSGGGIVFDLGFGSHGYVIVDSSTISGNSAGNSPTTRGGGIYATAQCYCSVNVTRSLISGNRAGLYGGGIATSGGVRFLMDSSTVEGNYAGSDAGGVFAYSSSTAFRDSTIAFNSTGWYYEGNGIYAKNTPGFFVGTIVAGNFNRGGFVDLEGYFNVDYSLIQNLGSFAFLTNVPHYIVTGVDPQLGPLADNGGPTWSLLPAATSPVIDAIKNVFLYSTDQRGLPRVAGARADIGAVERQYPEVIIFRNGFDSS